LDSQLTATATRAQMAHVLAGLLPEEALPSINDAVVTRAYAAGQAITDVTADTPYYQDILSLYRKGVCGGVDDVGTFVPDSPISRGAVAAMLTRILDPSLRLTLQWSQTQNGAQSLTLADLVTPGTYIASPTTEEEMDSSIRYMLASGSDQLWLQYSTLTVASARQIMDLALSTVKTYCEQDYNSVSCSYTLAGTMSLTFSAQGAGEQLGSYRTAAMEAAVAVHDQLWASGAITSQMSQWEKARVYYTWVCQNCTYDYSAGGDSLSHISYSLFQYGTAVCDGYTGAYNTLLKLEGIDCTALSNGSHIWTVATLDGTTYHIDPTWGDSGSAIDYNYFAMTPKQSWREHSW
jgi:hypothetical protein